MAIDQTVIWEVRTTGNAANGGGYKPGASGSDFSQQDSAQYALTGATSAGAGNVVLHASAAADMVGNICQVRSGTNFTASFFEITSVSVGVSFTCSTNQVGTAICTGVGAAGVINIGGAYKFGTATDLIFGAALQQGFTIYVKAGTYSMTNSTSFTDSVAAKPCLFEGYNTTRGDAPLGNNRPLMSLGGTSNDWGSTGSVRHLSFTGNAASPVTSDGAMNWYNCKFVNTSTAASRNAITVAAEDYFDTCEFMSINGRGFSAAAAAFLQGCYIHDSPIGVQFSSAGDALLIKDCIIAGCGTAINLTGANAGITLITGCTLYGSERKDGTGISIAANNYNVKLTDTIIYGFTTGISHATAGISSFSVNNNFFNNTTNRTNWAVGLNELALDPQFKNVTTVSGTAGVVSGSTLTDAGASFANVVDGQDALYIVSGTGVTVTPGAQLVSSHTGTVLTVPTAIGGSGTNISYYIRTGQNFTPGVNMRGVGHPGLFPGGLVTGYNDMGAVQRQEPTGFATAFCS